MSANSSAIAIFCRTCGSTDVSRDAWADWDVAQQKWVLRGVYDAAHDCDDETSLDERRVVSSLE